MPGQGLSRVHNHSCVYIDRILARRLKQALCMRLSDIQSVLSEVYSADKVSNGRKIDSSAIAGLVRKACTRRVRAPFFFMRLFARFSRPGWRSSIPPLNSMKLLVRILQRRSDKKQISFLDFCLRFYLKQTSTASLRR